VPRPRTSFVGRERELGSARRLLDGTRLLTLTGPGGSGKTWLSIALAARVQAGFRDGVRFVPLAAVRDPSLVPTSSARKTSPATTTFPDGWISASSTRDRCRPSSPQAGSR
jgi:hypothetical protein